MTTPQAAAADVAERSALVARQTGQTGHRRHREHGRFRPPDGTVFDVFGSGGGCGYGGAALDRRRAGPAAGLDPAEHRSARGRRHGRPDRAVASDRSRGRRHPFRGRPSWPVAASADSAGTTNCLVGTVQSRYPAKSIRPSRFVRRQRHRSLASMAVGSRHSRRLRPPVTGSDVPTRAPRRAAPRG